MRASWALMQRGKGHCYVAVTFGRWMWGWREQVLSTSSLKEIVAPGGKYSEQIAETTVALQQWNFPPPCRKTVRSEAGTYQPRMAYTGTEDWIISELLRLCLR